MPDDRADPRCQFSLAVLFRTVTLIALALGWLLAVPTAPPQAFGAVMILVGMMLGGVASARRRGAQGDRFKVWIGFLVGTVVIALYSSYVASVAQMPDDTGEKLSGIGRFLNEVLILAMLPLVVIIVVLMLRAWTWSAHDSSRDKTSFT